MTLAEEYLFKAAQLSALADDEANPTLSSGFRQLAERCLLFAEQLDRDSQADVVGNVPIPWGRNSAMS
jgi:hypothetical protein